MTMIEHIASHAAGPRFDPQLDLRYKVIWKTVAGWDIDKVLPSWMDRTAGLDVPSFLLIRQNAAY